MSDSEPKVESKPSVADQLIALGREKYDFHVDLLGAPYALPKDDPSVRRPFGGGTNPFRSALAHLGTEARGQTPPAAALTAALNVLTEDARQAGFDQADRMLDDVGLGESGSDSKASVATVLVELALDQFELGCTADGEAFAIPRDGPKIVRLVRGGRQSLRAELARLYFERRGAVAAQSALADAMMVLEGRSQLVEPAELHLRVAEHGSQLVLDLGDSTGRAVVISADGWTIVDIPPVLFRRTALSGVLPTPVGGGELDTVLWSGLNIATEYRPVLAAVLVSALMPGMPHVILSLSGEQGVAKTSTTRSIVEIIDPGPVPVRKAPKDADSWTTAAAGSWLVALDNLGEIQPWLSDALCRASTGDGDVRRRLYSDGDLHVVAFRRCVIINGIDLGALRDDLADRLVTVPLERIPDSERKLDAAVTAAREAAHPKVLGAVLDLAVKVLRELPGVQLSEMPRMADYARVLAAVDEVLETNGLATYLGSRVELAEDALNSDPVLGAISQAITEEWTGTAAQLLLKITPKTGADEDKWRPPKGWPAKPRELTSILKRRAPSLRRLGWKVDQDGKDDRTRAVLWKITPPAQSSGEDDARNARNARNDDDSAGQEQIDLASDTAESASVASDTVNVARTTASVPDDVARTLADHSQNARTPDSALTSQNGSSASVASETSEPSAPTLDAEVVSHTVACVGCGDVLPDGAEPGDVCFGCFTSGQAS